MKTLEDFLTAAEKHAEFDDDPEMRIGDLEGLLCEAWAVLSEDQRELLLTGVTATGLAETIEFEEDIS